MLGRGHGVGRGTTNRNARGGSDERRKRKLWLLATFGDGIKAPCSYCQRMVDFDTISVDRYPIMGCDGGTPSPTPQHHPLKGHTMNTTTATITVSVYLNTTEDWAGRPIGMMDGFQPEHTFAKAISYDTELAGAVDKDKLIDIAERACFLFNVGDDPSFGTPDELALQYRADGHRSLSVGDLVLVGESCLAVGRFGWDVVALPASLA